MKTKASVLTLRIPFELKHDIKLMAEKQGISINQLALYALTKEMKSLQTYSFLENYWKNKPETDLKSDYDRVLQKVRSKDNQDEVPDWDKMSEKNG